MTHALEYRRAATLSVAGRKLAGAAVKYGAIADLGRMRERIAPGAFAGSLAAGGDILALADHDPGKVLARTRSGTLRLNDTADALLYELDVPDTAAGRDMLALAERGDLGGTSFGMIVEDEERESGVRVIRRAKLFEITIVSAWPAYGGTTVEARRLWPGLMALGPDELPAPHSETRRDERNSWSSSQTPRLASLKRFLETL